MTAACRCALQWTAPSPLKIAPICGGSEPLSNTWFPGPTRVLNPNGISIGSAVCAGRIYLGSTTMWPHNTLLTGRDVPDIWFHLFGLQIWQNAVNYRMSKLDILFI